VPDRPQRGSADLARTLGDIVGHGEDLVGLLIQQKMIVAKMAARHVPMEILGFDVEGEDVRQQSPQRGRDVPVRVGSEIGRALQFCSCHCCFPCWGGIASL
jgi:hypothetical protein